ncbi:MAG: hypothetical protein ACMG6E_07310 [Candidatus Roizmanbacteria bacterium]
MLWLQVLRLLLVLLLEQVGRVHLEQALRLGLDTHALERGIPSADLLAEHHLLHLGLGQLVGWLVRRLELLVQVREELLLLINRSRLALHRQLLTLWGIEGDDRFVVLSQVELGHLVRLALVLLLVLLLLLLLLLLDWRGDLVLLGVVSVLVDVCLNLREFGQLRICLLNGLNVYFVPHRVVLILHLLLHLRLYLVRVVLRVAVQEGVYVCGPDDLASIIILL